MKRLFLVLILLNSCAACFSQEMILPLPEIFVQPDNNVPAPVYDVTVTSKDNFKVVLKWRSASLPGESFFAIERGNNGIDFAPINVMKRTAGTTDFEFIDDAPLKGKVFYRVKFTANQSVFYSAVTSTVLSSDASCRFYPNPVDKVLIVRSEVPVDVQIADRFGKPVISNRLAAGLKLVDVSTLAPGVYIITLFQKDSNRIITEKLVKK
jgi:hypothetical protein